MRTLIPRRAALLGALLLALPLSPTVLADDPSPGHALAPLPYPGQNATATLANGDVIAFDGSTVSRHDAAGSLLAIYATFTTFVFPSFVLVDETNDVILLGESSNGEILRLGFFPTSPNLVTTLASNYDADWEDGTHIIVSAATGGFGTGNQLFRVDIDTGTTTELCDVAGPSGPVAVAANGDVYYGTVTDLWPPPAGTSSVLRWSAAQLTGAPVLSEADATVLQSGLDGAASMAIDPLSGALYLAENNFGSGVNRIRRVGGPVLVEGTTFFSMSNLEFAAGDGVASFDPFQPPAGGVLRYNTTDFSTTYERVAVQTERPTLSFTGAGTSGPGPFDAEIEAAAPGGFAILFHDLTASVPASEVVLNLRFPLFLGLSPSGAKRIPGVLPLDAAGAASIGYDNPGGLEGGVHSLQALVFDSSAQLVGSTNATAF